MVGTLLNWRRIGFNAKGAKVAEEKHGGGFSLQFQSAERSPFDWNRAHKDFGLAF